MDSSPNPDDVTTDDAVHAFTAAFPEPTGVTLSPPVANYLLQVLNSVSLPVAADNFAEQAAIIVQAKRELTA